MKVTDPDVIKAGEEDLIESIKADLDLSAVQEILLDKIKSSSLSLQNRAVSFDVSGGEIVVHDGQIAFKIDFQLKTDMAIIFDREGNYIPDGDNSFSKKLNIDHGTEPLKEEKLSDQYEADGAVDKLEADALPEDPEAEYSYLPEDQEEEHIEALLEVDDINPDLEKENISLEPEGYDSSDMFDSEEIPEESVLNEASDKFDSEVLLDNIDGLEDEDILGDLSEEQELNPLDDLDDQSHDDDFEELLKESRQFWGKQEK